MNMSYREKVGSSDVMTSPGAAPWHTSLVKLGRTTSAGSAPVAQSDPGRAAVGCFTAGPAVGLASSGIYSSLPDARREVRRRWHDHELRRTVQEYLGDLPTCFLDEPRAVLFRNIASPHAEFCHFAAQARLAGVKPLGVEYLSDRFSTRNPDKINLAKLPIYLGANKHGQPMVSYNKVIDLKAADNRKFADIDTLWGGTLVDFHHGLLQQNLPDLDIFDISGWRHFEGKKASDYYKYFLSLFVCTGILFENFVTSPQEQVFFDSIVAPSIAEVESIFGVSPLIVKVVPEDDPADDIYWSCYPKHVADEIQATRKFIQSTSDVRNA